ncbi:ATP-binding protein [Streptomyces sp. NPDC059982]|uniref:ATP-binding protein n=1 Tax=unclassified Streptomyces TaxID=2593676 RepID=UPI0036A93BB2
MLYDENRTVHPVPRNAAQARERVRALVESCAVPRPGTDTADADDVLADVLLVTSELVTNAVRHGGGLLDFSASVCADGLRLEVTDASSTLPVLLPRSAGTVRVGGFGWPLVCRLARNVAIRQTPQGGKRIEVLVPLDGTADSADPAAAKATEHTDRAEHSEHDGRADRAGRADHVGRADHAGRGDLAEQY